MYFPDYRPRRFRRTENLRRLVRETRLSVDQLIYPLFVVPGSGVKNPVQSMPGVFQFSVDRLIEEVRSVVELDIPGVLLFGLPEKKTSAAPRRTRKTALFSRPCAQSRTPGLNLPSLAMCVFASTPAMATVAFLKEMKWTTTPPSRYSPGWPSLTPGLGPT